MKSFIKTVTLGMLAMLNGAAADEQLYNPVKSSVQNFNNKNFEKKVTLNREKGISVVQFYKASGKYFQRFI